MEKNINCTFSIKRFVKMHSLFQYSLGGKYYRVGQSLVLFPPSLFYCGLVAILFGKKRGGEKGVEKGGVLESSCCWSPPSFFSRKTDS